jgi:superfamily II DNA or RNA helicase
MRGRRIKSIDEHNTKNYDIPTTSYAVEMDTYFRNLEFNEKKETLLFHQYIINKFMTEQKRRGILIFHSMGVGKTLLAVSITEYFRKHEPQRKAIILAPRSLHSNFNDTISTYVKTMAATSTESPAATSTESPAATSTESIATSSIDEYYNFISLNSSTMYKQMGQINKSDEELEFEKNMGLFVDKITDGSLENSILIIDEYHNLGNAITNGSKNGLRLYNKIMKTKNIKLIFLSGTPIVNHPFELVCTMNMLRGYELFPENIRDFISFFVDTDHYTIKNKERFQNRIMGLVSYFGDEYTEGTRKFFPKELPLKMEYIPMSKEQFARYLEMREIEKKEEQRKASRPQANDFNQFNAKGNASSSYRIRSRQVSNFLIPDEAIKQKGTKITKNTNLIPPKTFEQLEIYSPKFAQILQNIIKHKGQLQLVFSQFTSTEGLMLFSKVLDANGYTQWEDTGSTDTIILQKPKIKKKVNKSVTQKTLMMDDTVNELIGSESDMEPVNAAADNIDDADNIDIDNITYSENEDNQSGGQRYRRRALSPKFGGRIYAGSNQTYAIISGDILPSLRAKIVEIFNAKDNMHGERISILLVSNQTGATGLDLHGVRAIHIMEPFWNWALIMQIIGRGVRYKSHIDYPEAEQNVQPYMYISTFPKTYASQDDSEENKYTTDMHIYLGARNNRRLIETFLMALIESSIDCGAHHKRLSPTLQQKIKCYRCSPTAVPLYQSDFYKDMGQSAENPCKPYSAKSIETNELIYTPTNGDPPITFYYKKTNPTDIQIYEYNKHLEGYIPIKQSHPYYGDLMRTILGL